MFELMLWCRTVACSFVLTVGCLSLLKADPPQPFIATFERFARHAELSPEQAGTLLLTELSCTACHTTNIKEFAPKAGPKLDAAGRRLQAAWVADFLRNPHQLKPGTTMPDVLVKIPQQQRESIVLALTAFIVSQQAAYPELKATGANPVPHEFWNKGNPESGKQLWHTLGCVACHEPDASYEGGLQTSSNIEQLLEELEPEQIAKLGLAHAVRTVASIPLPDLKAKYSKQGLAMFLIDPGIVRPAGRMPSLKLATMQAADLVAYLNDKPSTNKLTALPQWSGTQQSQLVSEGQKLFGDLGCAQCHTAKNIAAGSRNIGKALDKLTLQDNGCLSSQPSAVSPFFALDTLQRESLIAALNTKLKSQRTSQPTAEADKTNKTVDTLAKEREEVELTMLQLNCYACHVRDQRGGLARGRDKYFETQGQVDLGDEGRLPPPLTNVGRKLNANWLKKVLQGTGDVRPHLQIRMPRYPLAEFEPLLTLFPKIDATPKKSTAPPKTAATKPDPKLLSAGREIFNLGCVQCHPIRGEALPSIVGVDVGFIGTRVQHEWFHDFLLNPASLKPRTRMPTFFAEGAINKDILNGDVEQQIEALWQYLENIATQPLPEKIEQSRLQNFELIPTDKPILLRTFMESAGMHAIAVGLPERIHFAYDGENARLAELWQGRFLDAHGTWNDRFAPMATPLSSKRIAMPTVPEFAELPAPDAPWPEKSSARFLGYRLNAKGVPAFQIRIGSLNIADQLTAVPSRLADEKTTDTKAPASTKLLRSLMVTGSATASNSNSKNANGNRTQGIVWYRIAASSKPFRKDGSAYVTDTGLRVELLSKELMSSVRFRQSGGRSFWLIPVSAGNTVNVEYSW